MKHDVLTKFRLYLNEVVRNKNTADRYFFAVQNVFKDFQFDSLSEIPTDEVEQRLLKLKTKRDFSATKNGLKHLEKFSSDIKLPSDEFFKENSMKKRNWNQRPP